MSKMENPNTDPANILLRRIYERADEIVNSNRIEETFNVGVIYFGSNLSYIVRNTEPHTFSCTMNNGGIN